jgi:hypothetical protein
MSRREYIYAGVFVGLVVLAVVVELATPDPVDWTDSYERDDARPYGSEVLVAVLPELVPGGRVVPVEQPPYLHLRDTTRTGSAYLFVTNRFAPDPAETGALLDYVARGNDLFLAAQTVSGPFADSLNLRLRPALPFALPSEPSATDTTLSASQLADTARVQFANPRLQRPGGFPLRADAVTARIRSVDTARTALLAGVAAERSAVDAGNPTFVRTGWGKGRVLVSSTPRAFTNVHVLGEKSSAFVYRALSYLDPQATVYWDAHHKPLAANAQTPLRFVTSEPALRTAWWTLLAGLALFLFVHGRRRQRVIPERSPPTNATLEFVRTVGGLYHRRGNHLDLARTRIRYLLASIRERLDLSTNVIDEDWVERVTQRSGAPRADVEALATAILTVRRSESLSREELLDLERRIQTFREKRKR